MFPNISAVVLAAGLSSRMGTAKQLLPLSGKPLIRHCLDTIRSAGILDIIVVLGFHGEKIASVLSGLPLRVVFNELKEAEMADSARSGIFAVSPSSTGILMCPSDYPLVARETITTLVNEHHRYPGHVIVPVHGEKRGHPALFPRDIANEIFERVTLRDIVNRSAGRVRFVSVPDHGVLLDVDTEEDYRRIINLMQGVLQ